MKWFGQHIYDYVSRFRQDVHVSKVSGDSTLELSSWSTTAGHSGTLKFLKSGTATLDTYTAGNHTTAGETLGRIEAFGVTDGDTSVMSSYIEFTNDAISDADSVPGKIIFATSDADDAGTPTVRLTIDDDGKATFEGTVAIDEVSISAVQASAESFVDNDTSIMTSASIQDKIQAHYHYQYIHFLGNATVPADGDWMTVSGNGISNHTWNTDLGGGGRTVGSSTVTIPVGVIGAGIRIPYAGVLVGFTGVTNRASDHQSAVGLVLGEPTWNDYATFDCTLRAYHAADLTAGPDGTYTGRPVKSEDLSRSQAISAGQVIYPVVKDLGSSASVCKISMTIVIKTLIP